MSLGLVDYRARHSFWSVKRVATLLLITSFINAHALVALGSLFVPFYTCEAAPGCDSRSQVPRPTLQLVAGLRPCLPSYLTLARGHSRRAQLPGADERLSVVLFSDPWAPPATSASNSAPTPGASPLAAGRGSAAGSGLYGKPPTLAAARGPAVEAVNATAAAAAVAAAAAAAAGLTAPRTSAAARIDSDAVAAAAVGAVAAQPVLAALGRMEIAALPLLRSENASWLQQLNAAAAAGEELPQQLTPHPTGLPGGPPTAPLLLLYRRDWWEALTAAPAAAGSAAPSPDASAPGAAGEPSDAEYGGAGAAAAAAAALPPTWGLFVRLVSDLLDRDLDGDGLPDHVLCLDMMPGCKGSALLAAIYASLAQSRGTSQGVWFSQSDFTPLLGGAALTAAMRLYGALAAANAPAFNPAAAAVPPPPPPELAAADRSSAGAAPPACGGINPLFAAGRCLFTADWATAATWLQRGTTGIPPGALGVALLPGSEGVEAAIEQRQQQQPQQQQKPSAAEGSVAVDGGDGDGDDVPASGDWPSLPGTGPPYGLQSCTESLCPFAEAVTKSSLESAAVALSRNVQRLTATNITELAADDDAVAADGAGSPGGGVFHTERNDLYSYLLEVRQLPDKLLVNRAPFLGDAEDIWLLLPPPPPASWPAAPPGPAPTPPRQRPPPQSSLLFAASGGLLSSSSSPPQPQPQPQPPLSTSPVLQMAQRTRAEEFVRLVSYHLYLKYALVTQLAVQRSGTATNSVRPIGRTASAAAAADWNSTVYGNIAILSGVTRTASPTGDVSVAEVAALLDMDPGDVERLAGAIASAVRHNNSAIDIQLPYSSQYRWVIDQLAVAAIAAWNNGGSSSNSSISSSSSGGVGGGASSGGNSHGDSLQRRRAQAQAATTPAAPAAAPAATPAATAPVVANSAVTRLLPAAAWTTPSVQAVFAAASASGQEPLLVLQAWAVGRFSSISQGFPYPAILARLYAHTIGAVRPLRQPPPPSSSSPAAAATPPLSKAPRPPAPSSRPPRRLSPGISVGVAVLALCAVAGGAAGLILWRLGCCCGRDSDFAGEGCMPGAHPNTTLVITDVQGSTTLWEVLSGDLMDEVLHTHHRVVRQAICQFKGYEVFTEGDSFAVAFHLPEEALDFAMGLQAALLGAEWPPELLEQPDCAEVWARRHSAQPPSPSAAAAAAAVASKRDLAADLMALAAAVGGVSGGGGGVLAKRALTSPGGTWAGGGGGSSTLGGCTEGSTGSRPGRRILNALSQIRHSSLDILSSPLGFRPLAALSRFTKLSTNPGGGGAGSSLCSSAAGLPSFPHRGTRSAAMPLIGLSPGGTTSFAAGAAYGARVSGAGLFNSELHSWYSTPLNNLPPTPSSLLPGQTPAAAVMAAAATAAAATAANGRWPLHVGHRAPASVHARSSPAVGEIAPLPYMARSAPDTASNVVMTVNGMGAAVGTTAAAAAATAATAAAAAASNSGGSHAQDGDSKGNFPRVFPYLSTGVGGGSGGGCGAAAAATLTATDSNEASGNACGVACVVGGGSGAAAAAAIPSAMVSPQALNAGPLPLFQVRELPLRLTRAASVGGGGAGKEHSHEPTGQVTAMGGLAAAMDSTGTGAAAAAAAPGAVLPSVPSEPWYTSSCRTPEWAAGRAAEVVSPQLLTAAAAAAAVARHAAMPPEPADSALSTSSSLTPRGPPHPPLPPYEQQQQQQQQAQQQRQQQVQRQEQTLVNVVNPPAMTVDTRRDSASGSYSLGFAPQPQPGEQRPGSPASCLHDERSDDLSLANRPDIGDIARGRHQRASKPGDHRRSHDFPPVAHFSDDAAAGDGDGDGVCGESSTPLFRMSYRTEAAPSQDDPGARAAAAAAAAVSRSSNTISLESNADLLSAQAGGGGAAAAIGCTLNESVCAGAGFSSAAAGATAGAGASSIEVKHNPLWLPIDPIRRLEHQDKHQSPRRALGAFAAYSYDQKRGRSHSVWRAVAATAGGRTREPSPPPPPALLLPPPPGTASFGVGCAGHPNSDNRRLLYRWRRPGGGGAGGTDAAAGGTDAAAGVGKPCAALDEDDAQDSTDWRSVVAWDTSTAYSAYGAPEEGAAAAAAASPPPASSSNASTATGPSRRPPPLRLLSRNCHNSNNANVNSPKNNSNSSTLNSPSSGHGTPQLFSTPQVQPDRSYHPRHRLHTQENSPYRLPPDRSYHPGTTRGYGPFWPAIAAGSPAQLWRRRPGEGPTATELSLRRSASAHRSLAAAVVRQQADSGRSVTMSNGVTASDAAAASGIAGSGRGGASAAAIGSGGGAAAVGAGAPPSLTSGQATKDGGPEPNGGHRSLMQRLNASLRRVNNLSGFSAGSPSVGHIGSGLGASPSAAANATATTTALTSADMDATLASPAGGGGGGTAAAAAASVAVVASLRDIVAVDMAGCLPDVSKVSERSADHSNGGRGGGGGGGGATTTAVAIAPEQVMTADRIAVTVTVSATNREAGGSGSDGGSLRAPCNLGGTRGTADPLLPPSHPLPEQPTTPATPTTLAAADATTPADAATPAAGSTHVSRLMDTLPAPSGPCSGQPSTPTAAALCASGSAVAATTAAAAAAATGVSSSLALTGHHALHHMGRSGHVLTRVQTAASSTQPPAPLPPPAAAVAALAARPSRGSMFMDLFWRDVNMAAAAAAAAEGSGDDANADATGGIIIGASTATAVGVGSNGTASADIMMSSPLHRRRPEGWVVRAAAAAAAISVSTAVGGAVYTVAAALRSVYEQVSAEGAAAAHALNLSGVLGLHGAEAFDSSCTSPVGAAAGVGGVTTGGLFTSEPRLVLRGLRLRMGLHSGPSSAEVVFFAQGGSAGAHYPGRFLATSKDVCDAAAGGTVLASGATFRAFQQRLREARSGAGGGGGGSSSGSCKFDLTLLHFGEFLLGLPPAAGGGGRGTADDADRSSANDPRVARSLAAAAAGTTDTHTDDATVDLYGVVCPWMLPRLALLPSPVRARRQAVPGCLSAPAGVVAPVFLNVLGVESLLAWEKLVMQRHVVAAAASAASAAGAAGASRPSHEAPANARQGGGGWPPPPPPPPSPPPTRMVQRALELLRRAATAAAAARGGYVVAVSADGGHWVLVFGSASAAVGWGMDVLEAMLGATWPEGFLEHELTDEVWEDGVLVKRGLRLRIGADLGCAMLRPVPRTGRLDYVGRPMNRAARIAAKAKAASMFVSAAVWDAAKGSLGHRASAACLGLSHLKGVKEPLELWALRPSTTAINTVNTTATSAAAAAAAVTAAGAGSGFGGRGHRRFES